MSGQPNLDREDILKNLRLDGALPSAPCGGGSEHRNAPCVMNLASEWYAGEAILVGDDFLV